MEMRLGFFHGDREGIVVRLLPARRTDITGRIRRAAKDPAKEIAGSVEGIRHRSQRGSLELGLVAVAAAIAGETQTENRYPCLSLVIAGELNECHGTSLKVMM